MVRYYCRVCKNYVDKNEKRCPSCGHTFAFLDGPTKEDFIQRHSVVTCETCGYSIPTCRVEKFNYLCPQCKNGKLIWSLTYIIQHFFWCFFGILFGYVAIAAGMELIPHEHGFGLSPGAGIALFGVILTIGGFIFFVLGIKQLIDWANDKMKKIANKNNS